MFTNYGNLIKRLSEECLANLSHFGSTLAKWKYAGWDWGQEQNWQNEVSWFHYCHFSFFFSVTDIISYSGGDISWYGHLVLKEKEIDMKNMGLMHTVRDKDITKEISNCQKSKMTPENLMKSAHFPVKHLKLATLLYFFLLNTSYKVVWSNLMTAQCCS